MTWLAASLCALLAAVVGSDYWYFLEVAAVRNCTVSGRCLSVFKKGLGVRWEADGS